MSFVIDRNQHVAFGVLRVNPTFEYFFFDDQLVQPCNENYFQLYKLKFNTCRTSFKNFIRTALKKINITILCLISDVNAKGCHSTESQCFCCVDEALQPEGSYPEIEIL